MKTIGGEGLCSGIAIGRAIKSIYTGNRGDHILLGENLSPSLILQLKDELAGVVMKQSGNNDHTAVALRSLNIPGVGGVSSFDEIQTGETVAVDGEEGLLYYDLCGEDIQVIEQKRFQYLKNLDELLEYKGKRAVTQDGEKIQLLCTLNSVEEINETAMNESDGVGLFRSEFSCRVCHMQEQQSIYKYIVDSFPTKEVNVRLLDIGGDKKLEAISDSQDNPQMDLRGIRYLLKHKHILEEQLHALMNVRGKMDITIPMVSCSSEILQLKEVIHGILPKFLNYRLGAMIETPAAALMAEELLGHVDFFSIGTNDLIQYTMCAHRGYFGELYSIYQPAVLRLIARVASVADKAGVAVSVCGEAAADVNILPFFVGLGIRRFSVPGTKLLEIKRALKEIHTKKAREVVKRVLRCGDKSEVMRCLRGDNKNE